MKPSYLSLFQSEMRDRAKALRKKLSSCDLCPLECGVDRLAGETGRCNSGGELFVSSIAPHFGEERPLVGRGGSGTVFLSNCNLCVVTFLSIYPKLHISPPSLADRLVSVRSARFFCLASGFLISMLPSLIQF